MFYLTPNLAIVPTIWEKDKNEDVHMLLKTCRGVCDRFGGVQSTFVNLIILKK